MIVSFFKPIARHRKSAALLLGWMIVCSSLLFFSPNVHAGTQISRGTIAINGDSDFTAANGVTGGTGTASDPYIISGWHIEYQPVSALIGIGNTRAYFVVRNVTLYAWYNGIVLSNVTNGRLESLESDGGAGYAGPGAGIIVTGSNNIRITSVRVYASGASPNEGGGGPGIVVGSSSNIAISNSFMTALDSNLSVSSSTNVTIIGNNIGVSQNGYGMDLSGVNVTVSQNAFSGSGLVFSGPINVLPDNTVNGKPLLYYHDRNNLTLNNVPVGQLIISRCSNVQLSNLSVSGTDYGILMHSVRHALIQNVSSTSDYFGNLQIGGSTDVTIEHSDFSNVPLDSFAGPASFSAVSIYLSNNTIIDGSIFKYPQLGLSLSSDINATISGNIFAYGYAMVCLTSSTNVHIYHNDFFISPDYTRSCLSDTAPGHYWDNGFPSGGNYWSDNTGTDSNNDGIVDALYPIQGGVYQDRYPLAKPYPESISLTLEFNWSPYYPTTGQTASFFASAVGGVAPYTYTWDFGDGSTGSGRTVTHVYGKTCTPYCAPLVVMRVTDSASPQTSDTISHYLTVRSPPPPLTTSVTSTSQRVQVGESLRFDAASSGGSPPYTYSWNFGDGTTGIGLEVFHTYSSPGTFNTALTVNDSGSPQQTASAQEAITVVNVPPPLTASFIYSPSSPQPHQTITFTGSVSGGTPPYYVYWTFWDGSSATGPSVTHSYSEAANYTVIFYVFDSSPSQQQTTAQQTISVTNSPPTSSSQYTVSVVSGTDGNLYSSMSNPDGSWSAWRSLSGSTPSTPTVCRSGPGRVDLVVRGLDNGLYHKSFINGTWASSWDPLGGLTADQPACAVINGQLVIVVRGLNSAIYYETENLQSSALSGWTYLSGSSPSPPAVCTSGSSSLELVVRGDDNAIYHKTFSAGAWSSSWDKNPAGVTIDSPACAVLGNTLYVVVRGATTELWSTTFDLSSKAWAASWTDLIGFTSSMPELVPTTSMGRLDLVVRGMDSTIYHKSLVNGIWSSTWDSFNGITRYPVAIASDGVNLRVVVVAMDGSLVSNMLPLNGTIWSSWTSMNGSTNLTPSAA